MHGFLEDYGVHPVTYNMFVLLEETSGVSSRLQAQARQKPTFPGELLRLIQKYFNEIFCQGLERRHRVRWPNFKNMRRALATGSFLPEVVALPGGIAPPERPLPPPAAP